MGRREPELLSQEAHRASREEQDWINFKWSSYLS